MGNPKQKWTAEEEDALKKGVVKHGTGKWKDIQRDPEFNPFLRNRSNIDLKDKWRNLSCSANGQGPREKSRSAKPKPVAEIAAAQLPAPLQTAAPAPAVLDAPPAATNLDESTKSDGKNSSMYSSMIFEAISALKEPNGSDTSAIVNFIERKHEVPPNFRRLLSTRLRRLVAQDKLEKVQNYYRLKVDGDVSSGPKTPAPRVENQPRQLPNVAPKRRAPDPLEEAAASAALKFSDVDNKSFLAAEAIKELEKTVSAAEESEAILQFVTEIYEKCANGEVVYFRP